MASETEAEGETKSNNKVWQQWNGKTTTRWLNSGGPSYRSMLAHINSPKLITPEAFHVHGMYFGLAGTVLLILCVKSVL